MSEEPGRLLTTRQAADLLKISYRTMYGWLRNGNSPVKPLELRIGKRVFYRWDEKELLRMLRREE